MTQFQLSLTADIDVTSCSESDFSTGHLRLKDVPEGFKLSLSV